MIGLLIEYFISGYNLKHKSRTLYVNVWQKPNGEFYVKLTKHRSGSYVMTSKNFHIGDYNNYGHKLIDSIRQYIDLSYIE